MFDAVVCDGDMVVTTINRGANTEVDAITCNGTFRVIELPVAMGIGDYDSPEVAAALSTAFGFGFLLFVPVMAVAFGAKAMLRMIRVH